ncbi:MAG: hypothetical protein IJS67_01640, partial [Clostridia bacterium]|nr:hypothetical protein [Clostridia bacterium]
KPMDMMAEEYREAKAIHSSKFMPAGQTTQMIVGASPETDGHIVRLAEGLYKKFSLKRVYFSSYVPTNFNSTLLPAIPTGLLREHRLYQADWLMRYYGFTAREILDEDENLSEDYDPKCAWALKHPEFFPVEINSAPFETLVRVPGIGFKGAYKIVGARRYGSLDFPALMKMRIVLKRAIHFITCKGKFIGDDNPSAMRNLLTLADMPENFTQTSLFSSPEIAGSVITGEL